MQSYAYHEGRLREMREKPGIRTWVFRTEVEVECSLPIN